jgi:hypothetical protein
MIEEPNQASEAFQASRAAIQDYQSAVGSIMYAANVSRPDISYSLSVLARFLTNPDERHQAALQRVNDYLAYTSHYAITYRADDLAFQAFRTGTATATASTITSDTGVEDGTLRGYVDASYASCPDTRRSRTGYVFFLAGGPVAWGSKRQSCVAKSSTEAEYIGLSDAGGDALWLQSLMRDITGAKASPPALMATDSQSAMAMTENQRTHGRTKHIDVRWHWIREKVEENKLALHHVSGTELVADGLTKPLGGPAFREHVRRLRLYDGGQGVHRASTGTQGVHHASTEANQA